MRLRVNSRNPEATGFPLGMRRRLWECTGMSLHVLIVLYCRERVVVVVQKPLPPLIFG